MYQYVTEKQKLLTEEGQRDIMIAYSIALAMIEQTGAFTVAAFMVKMSSKLAATDTWYMLALIDRLVEIGRLRKIPCDWDSDVLVKGR